MPTARGFVATATVNNKIYTISGGTRGSSPLNTVEMYDPSQNTWSTLASVPTPRHDAAAAAVGSKIYVIGGEGPGVLKTVSPPARKRVISLVSAGGQRQRGRKSSSG
jgi:N-acetylneuraminic acid mutarotase